jgi:hypothetical protein
MSATQVHIPHYLIIIFVLSYVLLRMPIRSTMKGDSFWSAHTWRKCSFVTKNIQHVGYLSYASRVTKNLQKCTAHESFLLTQSVTNDILLST